MSTRFARSAASAVVVCVSLALAGGLPVRADGAARDTEAETDTLVICAPELAPALEPWLAYRRGQGHQIAVMTRARVADRIRQHIRDVARNGHLRHVLLVGDAPAPGERLAARQVPTHLATARVTVRWGSEPQMASDNWFADLDDDRLPELAIGRLTADSRDELSAMIEKVVAYERDSAAGLWQRRVNIVAGVGGFGRLTDFLLETSAKKLITDGIPAAYRTSMTYTSWRSPYFPDPRRLNQTVMDRLNEGCLAWVYLGHGHVRHLEPVRLPGGSRSLLTAADMHGLACREGTPLAVFLSCYAGAFDQPEDCLAEEMLRAPQGPVAAIGGSRVTMPYAMAVLGNALLEQLFRQRRPTFGEVLLHAKRSLSDTGQTAEDARNRQWIDGLARLASPHAAELATERMEHVHLFNLIGDPLLPIRYPESVRVQVAEYATAGDVLQIEGVSDIDGACLVEAVCRRDRTTFLPPTRHRFDTSPAGLAAMQHVYQQANDGRWNATAVQVTRGRFAARLPLPAHAKGPSHVRVFVQGQNGFAMGSADVYVRRQEAEDGIVEEVAVREQATVR